MLELNKFLELVEKVSATQEQERTILYSSEIQKSALEQYLGIKIESDDCIVTSTKIGSVRLVRASDVVIGEIGANQIFLVDGMWD